MARPTKFTRETIDRLMRGIRMGLTYELACMHAGIDYNTFNDWRNGKFPRRLDDDQKQLKIEFLDMLTRAEGDSAMRHMSTIMQAAAQGDWKAAAWALERRWPHHYGKEVVELTGKDGGPVEISRIEKELSDLAAQVASEEGIEEFESDLLGAVMARLKVSEEKGGGS